MSDRNRHQVRPTRAEIDLEAICHNVGIVRAHAGARKLYGVVKADAYGHGLVPVARALAAAGIDGLCVALVEEGIALRDAGLDAPIVVLNGIYGQAHHEVVGRELEPVIYDLADVARFDEIGGVRAHLKVDTGMNRLGVSVEGEVFDRFLERVGAARGIELVGVMTHLASAESDVAFTARQLARFAGACDRLASRGHRPPLIHAANSAGTLVGPDAGTMVRPGIALYGVSPVDGEDFGLRPAMRVVTSVVRVSTIECGQSVGYGSTWTAARKSTIATLALGYGDGLMRALSNCGAVLIGGVRCPIVGAVSMDLTGVDVTDVPAGCARGDEAVIVGAQGSARIDANELATHARTIGYEILTSIAPRVPRHYEPPA